jgi:hypothetical protein
VRACAVAQTGGYVIATRRGVRYAGSLALSLFVFTFTFPKFSAQRRGGAPTRCECLLRGSLPLKTSLAEGHECPFRLSCGLLFMRPRARVLGVRVVLSALGVFGGAFVHRVYFAGVVYTRSLPSIHLKRFSLLFHLLLARRTSCGCARGRRRHESGGGDACESTVQQQLAPAVPLHLLPTRSASRTAAASRRRSSSRATEQGPRQAQEAVELIGVVQLRSLFRLVPLGGPRFGARPWRASTAAAAAVCRS